MDHFYAAILAGGRGTRLWPQSRAHRPKQFTDIIGDGQTMIQATAARLHGLAADDHLYVITGRQYAKLTADQLPQMPRANILVEPSGRNTAPAIGLACIHIQRRDPDAIMAIFPADHVMTAPDAFREAVRRGVGAAQEGYLVTLGIQPTEAHTGYGYIKRGQLIHGDGHGSPIYAVAEFLEKPQSEQAQAFLAAGDYYWNGGIFISRVDRMLAEMARQMPETFALLEAINAGLDDDNAAAILEQAWEKMPSQSIDYGVMEDAERVAVTPLNAGWNDVGSWDALGSVLPADDDGNLIISRKNVIAVESHNNIIVGEERLVALIGVEDLVVVDTGDALLIGRRQKIQKVKTVVETLKENRQDLL